LIEVRPANVVLSAMRLVEPADGKTSQWELRVYETTGQATDVIVRLARPVCGIQQTNLLGEPTTEVGTIDVRGREIRLHMEPWKIVTARGQWAE
jgi:alpha-mannosidase